MKAIIVALFALIAWPDSAFSGTCKAVVKYIGSVHSGEYLIIKNRVYAGSKDSNRKVYYSFLGKIKIHSYSFGSEMYSAIYGTGSVTIDSAEDFKDDQYEYYLGRDIPMEEMKMNDVSVMGCFSENVLE